MTSPVAPFFAPLPAAPAATARGVLIESLAHQELDIAQHIVALLNVAQAEELLWLQADPAMVAAHELDDVRLSSAQFLGAWGAGGLLGSISFAPDDEAGQMCISTLVVHPLAQRQGLGRRLVIEALRSAPQQTFGVVAACANARALALYQGLGFAPYRRGSMGPAHTPVFKLRRAALP